MPAIFDQQIYKDGTVGSSAWIDLGIITPSQRLWFGNATFYGEKPMSFTLYTNTVGNSGAVAAQCTALGSASVSTRSPSVTSDYYRKGRLHTVSVYGTAAGEHCWIYIKSKSSTIGAYQFNIWHTWE